MLKKMLAFQGGQELFHTGDGWAFCWEDFCVTLAPNKIRDSSWKGQLFTVYFFFKQSTFLKWKFLKAQSKHNIMLKCGGKD